MGDKKGFIYDIQRFAIHDGPGIRTLVYMKGCPMKCLWCSSPQTQKSSLELLHYEMKCTACGRCTAACSFRAITISEKKGWQIDRELCNTCGTCVQICPNNALEIIGKWVMVDELFEEIKEDNPFYRRSGGGVTLGGGEPTMQPEFVTALLKKCNHGYIHTAIETCGYVKWEIYSKILEYVDLVFMDVKHMDPAAHREIAGVPNNIVLENARRAADIRPIVVRIPIVPGLNDSDQNISETGRFAAALGKNLIRVELLPYHKFGTQTYERLGMEFTLRDVEPPDEDRMKRLKKLIESYQVKAQIGG